MRKFLLLILSQLVWISQGTTFADDFRNTSIPRTAAQIGLLRQKITASDVNAALDAQRQPKGTSTSENATLNRLRAYRARTGKPFLTVKNLALAIPPAPKKRILSPVTNFATNHCASNNYPAQWRWTPAQFARQPLPATGGKPLIKHIRNGKLIATYSKFGQGTSGRPNMQNTPDPAAGAFHRNGYQNWKDGDLFEVYPAIYEGDDQQPWIGQGFINDTDYTAEIFNTPKNITIRGITVNGSRPVIRLNGTGASNNSLGQAPVYFDKSENIVFENFDIDGSGATSVGMSGIYANGAKNLTLRNLRIHGFRKVEKNGIFGTGNNAGLFRMENIELYDNGGGGGPEHNIYMNHSTVDPNFTVSMRGSWSHDAYYGHLFKSRAQRNILDGNYFSGARSKGVQTENFIVDVPEGGTLVMRNNVLVKDYSGDNSNGISVTFAMENRNNSATDNVLIENNTFVAFSKFYDTQEHTLRPMQFLFPAINPGAAAFPVTVRNNVFVGYCKSGDATQDYRGTGARELNFNQIDKSFQVRAPQSTGNFAILGSPAYGQLTRSVSRTTLGSGARD